MSNSSRPYGAGSITPAGKGKWLVRASHGRRADGQPRRIQRTVVGTKADAERELVRIHAMMGTSPNVGDSMTLDEYFYGVFIPTRGKVRAKKTLSTYESIYRNHIGPEFGHWRADQITKSAVQLWVLRLPTAATADKALRHLRAILRAMWSDDLLDEEPLRKTVMLPPHQVDQAPVWEPDELFEALDRLRGHRLEPLVLTMAGGGLRREEALGLDLPGDMEFGEALGMDGESHLVCRAIIRRAWTDEDGQRDLTKTYRIRPVTIGEPFSERLHRILLDGRPKLLLRLDGKPMQPTSLPETWRRAFHGKGPLKGMRYMELRLLRKCHETISARAGVGDAENAKFHGHGQLVMYRHYLSIGSDAADAVAEAVRQRVAR